MDIATQTHLTSLRDLLTYRLHELRAEVHAAELSHAEPITPGGGDAQEQRDADELAEVEAALSRLDSGTYGDCMDCGEPISLQRLVVQPAAERCVRCEHELHRRQLGRAS